MISAVKTTRRPLGFTLIEIVLVMAIAAIIMGGAVGLMVYAPDERLLRDASGEIEMLAKRARATAILQQTPYALEFREGIVRLMPLAQAGRDEEKKVDKRHRRGDPEEETSGNRWELTLDNGMQSAIRRWNSAEFVPIVKKTVHVWRFDPNGLCEPISVRLMIGKSWSEDTYHPLTATIRESQLEAR